MKIMSGVARDALELPPNQRLSLARFLLDVSDGETGFDTDANEAWEEEISQRIEKIRNDTAKSIPLGVTVDRLRVTPIREGFFNSRGIRLPESHQSNNVCADTFEERRVPRIGS